MFAFYINHSESAGIFRSYGGYISLLPNLIGYVATRLSISFSPYFMVFSSLWITSCAFTVFALPRYRFALASDKGRMALCLILGLLPLGNSAIRSSITYSQWHLLWLFLILILAPLPRSTLGRIGQLGFLVVTAWSHPLSILGIPLLGLTAIVRWKKDEIFNSVGLITAIVAYQLIGVDASDAIQKISFSSIGLAGKYILHRVVFESIFGNRLRLLLHEQQMDWMILLFALSAIGILCLLLWNERRRISNGNWLWIGGLTVIIAGVSLGSVIGRSMDGNTHLGGWEQRYFYIQQMAFVLTCSIALFYFLSSRQWSAQSRSLWIRLGIVVGVSLVWSNFSNRVWFDTSAEAGQKVQAFVREVDSRLSHSHEMADGSMMIFDRGGGFWDIRIDISSANE